MKLAILTLLILICCASFAEAACPGSCVLSWQDMSNNEDGFRVYQKINLGNYTLMSPSLPANTTSMTLPALPAAGPTANTYCYALSAFNKAGESAMSTDVACYTVAAVVVLPIAPSGVGLK